MMLRLRLAAALACLLAAAGLAGCGDDDGPPACSEEDTDGDGLDGCQEETYGTSPQLADTDGDGLSDGREVLELGFDPANNNFKFNPLIADVPKISINLVSPPDLELLVTSSMGTTTSTAVSRSATSAATVTSSSTSSNSTAVEVGQTTGGSVTVGVDASISAMPSIGASAETTVSYEFSESTTREQGFSWTDEQSRENSTTYDMTQETAVSMGAEITGGTMQTTVKVRNEGLLSFTVTNLLLSAVYVDPGFGSVLVPIGNLALENQGGFQSFSLGYGQQTGNLVFTTGTLTTSTMDKLLHDSSGLILSVAAYELTDENGVSFAHDLTDIGARTASVLIDYDNRRTTEEYLVATNADPANLRITVKHALTDILRAPYTVGAGGGLTSVRDVADDPAARGSWIVVHITTDGVDRTMHKYDASAPYAFEDIILKSGDVLHLIYVEDPDGDGLGNRAETIYGTRADTVDSDADGIPDGEEVYRFQKNPVRPDSDADGKPDGDEVFVRVAAGFEHGLGISRSGKLWAWGANDLAQTGGPVAGAENCGINCFSRPVAVVGATGTWVDVAAGVYQSAAIDAGGALWMWGTIPQSGATPARPWNGPVTVDASTDWVQVAVGQHHALGRKADGTIWAWGINNAGQLGTGVPVGNALQLTPTQIGTDTDWAFVAAGQSSSFAIKTDGTLWAWGLDNVGALGIGGAVVVELPTQVGTDSDWLTVSTWLRHTAAVKTDGSLWAWGVNDYGEVGVGMPGMTYKTPQRVGVDTDWDAVAVGQESTTARKRDGRLYTWGRSPWIGQGNSGDLWVPTQLGAETLWDVTLESGAGFTVAPRWDGRVAGWGANQHGQLGDGTLMQRFAPTLLAP
jgi:alpha-tubulin suppressor-like RCC1 family protein